MLFGIIPVVVKDENGNTCFTYALLDDGADKSLCDERLINALHLTSRPVTFKISTVSSTGGTIYGQELDLHVQPINDDDEVSLRNVWSVKRLPVSTQSATVNADMKNLSYLAGVDVHRIDTKNVMLLIGTDFPGAHIPMEVLSGNCDQPYATCTRLGWAIRGPSRTPCTTKEINVNFQNTSVVLLQQQLERNRTTDLYSINRDEPKSMSVGDKRAMQSLVTFENQHYRLGRPWRYESTRLPYNMALALAHLQQLKRKLYLDSSLHQKCAEIGNYYISGVFWRRWIREYLPALHARQK